MPMTEEQIRERLWHYLAGEGFGPKWAQRIVQPASLLSTDEGNQSDARMVNAAVKLCLEIANG